MAETTSSLLRGLVLSAFEIKELTGWPDAMVEDYLNILRNLITLADSIDEISSEATDVSGLTFPYPFQSLRFIPDTVVVYGDYTLPTTQRVICANATPSTITMNDAPEDMETAYITRAMDQITIDGNGKTINGETSITVTEQYTTLNIVYITEIDGWIIS
jgi:hypothetical protein